ncbi:Uncharacterised protein [Streptococcus pneumoniae]|nr:Uncharacterised protein [Streptococcus pneumoniae]
MKTLVELMEERQKHADELSEIKFKYPKQMNSRTQFLS